MLRAVPFYKNLFTFECNATLFSARLTWTFDVMIHSGTLAPVPIGLPTIAGSRDRRGTPASVITSKLNEISAGEDYH